MKKFRMSLCALIVVMAITVCGCASTKEFGRSFVKKVKDFDQWFQDNLW